MKKVVKVMVFLAVFVICANYIYDILLWKNSTDNNMYNIQHFYELEDNTVDALFLGSSHCFCTVNNAILWDDYGISSYNLATGCQNIGNTFYFFKEALKTQKPKVAIIEMYYTSAGGYGSGDIYRNTLGMHLSKNYIDNVKYSLSIDDNDIQFKDMVFKWPVVHTRYSELTKADFVDPYPDSLGYYSNWVRNGTFTVPQACMEKQIGVLSEDKLLYLDKIVQLAKNNNIELVFFVAPYILTPEEQQTYNALEVYAKENNIIFYNFNSIYDEIEFDYSQDMWEQAHLNSWGAEKVSDYLGKVLSENYNFIDRHNDSKYERWQNASVVWNNEKAMYE